MPEHTIARKIGWGTIFISGSNLLTAVIEFLITLLLIRLLDPAAFGLFNLALGIILIFNGFTSFGVDAAAVRYVSTFRALGKRSDEKTIVYSVFLFKSLLSIVCGALLFLFRHHLAIVVYSNPSLLPLLTAGSFLVVVLALFATLTLIFSAYKQMHLLAMVQMASSLIKAIFYASLLYFVSSAEYAMYAFLFSQLFTVLILFFVVPKLLPDVPFKHFDWSRFKLLLPFGFYVYLATILKTLFENSGYLIIGYLSVLDVVGHYSFAYKLSSVLFLVISGIATVIFPYFSEFYARNQKGIVEGIINKVYKYLSILCFPLIVLVPFVSKSIIGFLGKNQYIGAAPIFSILVAASVLRGFSLILATTLQAFNRPRELFITNFILFVSNAALILLLWGTFGVLSVPIAGLLAWLLTILRYSHLLNKKDIRIDAGAWFWPIPASLVMGAVLFLIRDYVVLDAAPGFAFFCVTGAAVYFTSLYLLGGISKEDFLFLKRNLG